MRGCCAGAMVSDNPGERDCWTRGQSDGEGETRAKPSAFVPSDYLDG